MFFRLGSKTYLPTMTGVKKAPPNKHMLVRAKRLPLSWTKYISPTAALTKPSKGANPTPCIGIQKVVRTPNLGPTHLKYSGGNQRLIVVARAAPPNGAGDDDDRSDDEQMPLTPNASQGDKDEARNADSHQMIPSEECRLCDTESMEPEDKSDRVGGQ